MRHLPLYKNTPNITMPLRPNLCKDQFSRFPSRHPHHLRSHRRIPCHSMSSRDLLSRSRNTKCATVTRPRFRTMVSFKGSSLFRTHQTCKSGERGYFTSMK